MKTILFLSLCGLVLCTPYPTNTVHLPAIGFWRSPNAAQSKLIPRADSSAPCAVSDQSISEALALGNIETPLSVHDDIHPYEDWTTEPMPAQNTNDAGDIQKEWIDEWNVLDAVERTAHKSTMGSSSADSPLDAREYAYVVVVSPATAAVTARLRHVGVVVIFVGVVLAMW